MKIRIGHQNVLYPMPITLVGATVDGRPNFINIGHVGILNASAPHLISLGMNKEHYTNRGIRKEKVFSVNIPAQDQYVVADYVGIASGERVDKAELFDVTPGEVTGAPMIGECPLSMECRLHDTVDTPTHDVFIGEIVATYASEAVLTDGQVDLRKVRPLLFDMTGRKYWSVGYVVGDCWRAGEKLITSP